MASTRNLKSVYRIPSVFRIPCSVGVYQRQRTTGYRIRNTDYRIRNTEYGHPVQKRLEIGD
jgi:hypothetical protein